MNPFDFGGDFERFVLIGAIALIVLGPDRFPRVAREAGKWYRVIRAYADDVMQDVRGAFEELENEAKDAGTELRQSVPDELKQPRELRPRD